MHPTHTHHIATHRQLRAQAAAAQHRLARSAAATTATDSAPIVVPSRRFALRANTRRIRAALSA
jgi:hypothetical protein